MRPRVLVLIAAGALALGLSVAVAARVTDLGPSFHGTAYVPPDTAHPFRLVGHTGQPVELADFRGSAVLLFFGFAHCPDVCPLTLAKLQRVVDALPERDARRVRVVLVTVDPARDTPEALADYVARFGDHVHGLTGDSATLAEVRAAYGAYAGPHSMQHQVAITHTPSVFGIDRDGRLRVLLSMEQTEEQLAEDVRALLRG